MKRYTVLMISAAATLCNAQVAMVEKDDIPGDTLVCVTNYGPYIASVATSSKNYTDAVGPWTPATSFTFTTNAAAITITGYTGAGGWVRVPEHINGFPVVKIGASAFSGKSAVTAITLPSTLRDISSYAFQQTGIATLTVPVAVTNIGAYALYYLYAPTLYMLGPPPVAGDFGTSGTGIVYAYAGYGYGATLGGIPVSQWGPALYPQSNPSNFVTAAAVAAASSSSSNFTAVVAGYATNYTDAVAAAITQRVYAVESRTNLWDTAYGWGDWRARMGVLEGRTNFWDLAYSLAYAASTSNVTRLVDSTGTLWQDGTGTWWRVHSVTNTAMANWKVTVSSDIKNGAGSTIITNGYVATISDTLTVPPLANGVYALQSYERDGYRWSIYNQTSGGYYLTVYIYNIAVGAGQYLSQYQNPPTYTNAICTAWPGGASSGQCRVTYTPIVYDVSVATSAYDRTATTSYVHQVAAALYPASNPSNFVGAATVTNIALVTVPTSVTNLYASVSNLVAMSTNAVMNAVLTAAQTTNLVALSTNALPTSAAVSNVVAAAGFYTPVTNYAAVAVARTNIVTVNAAKTVYELTLTNTVNYITNNLSALSISGKRAEWTLGCNFTNTNGLTAVWQGMNFPAGAPELTVTGRYEIACSTVDGVNVTARQTFPTVYPLAEVPFVAGNNTGNNGLGFTIIGTPVIAAANTNGWLYYRVPRFDVFHMAQIAYIIGATASTTNTVTCYHGAWLSGLTGVQSDIVANTIYSPGNTRPTPWFIVPPMSQILTGGNASYANLPFVRNAIYYYRSGATAGDIVPSGMRLRQATELESAAAAAGWKP